MKKLYRCLIFIVMTHITVHSQVILTEIMFDPDTLEYYCEYIEIYNSSQTSINLQNWSVGTSQDMDLLIVSPGAAGMVLGPGKYGLIFDPGYFEYNLDIYDFIDSTGVLFVIIDDNAFSVSGLSNSREDTVQLMDNLGNVVQQYKYSLDNSPGYSDEKIDMNENNADGNWANCTQFRGTPGHKNSVSLADFNLKIREFKLTDEELVVTLINDGKEAVNESFLLGIFLDFNFDHILDLKDISLQTKNVNVVLSPGDSVEVNMDGIRDYAGYLSLFVSIDLNVEIFLVINKTLFQFFIEYKAI